MPRLRDLFFTKWHMITDQTGLLCAHSERNLKIAKDVALLSNAITSKNPSQTISGVKQ